MNKNTNKTNQITYTALCTAVIAICSQISIPLPAGIPITLQTFSVILCGLILGPKNGTVSVFIYLLLGICGFPVFSNFRCGFSVLAGLTGGFLAGFIPVVFLCGIFRNIKDNRLKLICIIFSIIPLHICGCIHYSVIGNIGLSEAFFTVSLPFVAKDILLAILSYTVYKKIKARLLF